MTEYYMPRRTEVIIGRSETVEIPDDAVHVEVEYKQEVKGEYRAEVCFLEPL